MKGFHILVLVAIVLVLCFTITPKAQAATNGDLTYEVTDGAVTITGYSTSPTGTLTIPDSIGDYPVIAIADEAFENCSFTKLVIGNNVETIGEYAFQRCMGMTSVTFGSKLTTIGKRAFSQCHSLTEVRIPSSVTTIGTDAFHYTVGLGGIWVDAENPAYSSDDRGVLFNKDKTLLIQAPNLLCDTYAIPDSVLKVENYAFFNCSSLKAVTIADSVKALGDGAFDASGIETVTLGNGLTSIDSSAFSSCNNLQYNTFDNCYYLGTANNPYFALIKKSSASITNVVIHSQTKLIGSGSFSYNSELTEVTFPSGIRSIGNSAFNGCSKLTTLNGTVFSKDLEYIGKYAFYGCPSLTAVPIPAATTYIGPYAFANCPNLTGIWVDASNSALCSDEQGVLYDKHKTVLMQAPTSLSGTYAIPDGVIRIESSAFYGCGGLAGISIPNGVTDIGNSAFYKCIGLTAINIPDSVTSIGSTAFYECQSLKDITLPKHLTALGSMAFYKCTALTEIMIPSGITSIANQTFQDCTALKKVGIPNSITKIQTNAFRNCTGLETAVYCGTQAQWDAITFAGTDTYLSNAAKVIHGAGTVGSCPYCATDWGIYGENITWTLTSDGLLTLSGSGPMSNNSRPFQSNEKIKEVVIEDGITTVGGSAFSGCRNIERVSLPTTLTTIELQAFYACSGLKEISFPNNLTTIESSAFAYCKSLPAVTIPRKVTSIGNQAFSDCTALETVKVYGQLGSVAQKLFYNCIGLTSVSLPASIVSIEKYAFYNCAGLELLTVPAAVTEIGEYAFYGCAGMEQVNFGTALSKIGQLAFYGCKKLTALTFPNSLTYIGVRAFENCTGLEKVTFGTGLQQIDQDAFCYCEALTQVHITDLAAWCQVQFGKTDSYGYGYKTNPLDYAKSLYLNGELLRELVLPCNVSANTFRNCTNIVSVTIPQSVTSIGQNAFYNCKNLNHILHIGSRQDYTAIVMNTGLPGVYTWCRNAAGNEIYTSNACVTTDHICSLCNKTLWTEDRADGSHTWTAATCTMPKTCSLCNAVEGEAMGHSGGVWIELITPTCAQGGMKARICDTCSETEIVTLDPLGHSYSAVVTAPSCTVDGFTTYTCSTCGDSYTDNPITAGGHKFGTWTQTQAPSCEVPGQELSACENCGETQSREVAALGHTDTSVTVAPTCTETGYTTKTCSVCGSVRFTDQMAAKGHSWSTWIQTAAPSCTKEGSRIRFCNCGTKETEVLPKTHKSQNGICTACGVLESYYWVLSADAAVELELSDDLYVDLAGYELTGTIKTNGFKIYGMDSSTDGYTCEEIGYMNCADETGKALTPVAYFKSDISGSMKRYMAIDHGDHYTFHRFYLAVTHKTLRPTTGGIGYKAVFYGDEMVIANLQGFGFNVQLGQNTPHMVTKSTIVSGKTITLRIDNYNVEKHGQTELYASAVLVLKDGSVIEGTKCVMTLRTLLEELNAKHNTLSATQLAAVTDFIKKFDIIATWKVENLI